MDEMRRGPRARECVSSGSLRPWTSLWRPGPLRVVRGGAVGGTRGPAAAARGESDHGARISVITAIPTASMRSPRGARVFRSAAPADAASLGMLRMACVLIAGALVGGIAANFGAPGPVAAGSMAAVCLGALLFAGRHALAAAAHGLRRDVRRVVVLYLRWARSHRGAGVR